MLCNKEENQTNKGFTLIEIIVAFTLFALVLGGALNILTAGVAGQRRALAQQDITGELSLATEYIGRALRQARKDDENSPNGQCLLKPGFGFGWNYQITDNAYNAAPVWGEKIRFLDRGAADNNASKRCREIFFDPVSGQIQEKISSNATEAGLDAATIVSITSSNIDITALRFREEGAEQAALGGSVDNRQPRVTIFIEAKSKKEPKAAPVRVQTTVTQRVLDVRR